jgi:hypothetical protein
VQLIDRIDPSLAFVFDKIRDDAGGLEPREGEEPWLESWYVEQSGQFKAWVNSRSRNRPCGEVAAPLDLSC